MNIGCFRCIKGLLKNKIVILVTHQVNLLEYADDIVCLREVSWLYFQIFFSNMKCLREYKVIVIDLLQKPIYQKNDKSIVTICYL